METRKETLSKRRLHPAKGKVYEQTEKMASTAKAVRQRLSSRYQNNFLREICQIVHETDYLVPSKQISSGIGLNIPNSPKVFLNVKELELTPKEKQEILFKRPNVRNVSHIRRARANKSKKIIRNDENNQQNQVTDDSYEYESNCIASSADLNSSNGSYGSSFEEK